MFLRAGIIDEMGWAGGLDGHWTCFCLAWETLPGGTLPVTSGAVQLSGSSCLSRRIPLFVMVTTVFLSKEMETSEYNVSFVALAVYYPC